MKLSQAGATSCACTVFGNPSGQSTFDNNSPIEVGLKFIPSVSGTISGVRFYKQSPMAGTHTGNLWTIGGTNLATATFTGETASGWQDVTFSTPVAVTAGTTYVASVTMGDNRYMATSNYFTSDVVSGFLTAPSSGSSGGNGVFGTGGSFPAGTFGSANYWIDVSFYDTTAPTVASVAPTNGSTDVLPGETVSATFDQNMDATTLTGSTFTVKDSDNNTVAGTVSYTNATKTVSFIATDGFLTSKTYTATIKGGSGTVAKSGGGTALASDYTWSFTTSATNGCPCTLKARAAPEGSKTFTDGGSGLEIGVKIKPSTNGYITSVRFYKSIVYSSSSHVGNIWDGSGNKLATVTFSNETAYGWQEAKLSSPLRVNKDQVYIVSYGTTDSFYVATAGGLDSTITSGYINAFNNTNVENTATGSSTSNGVFAGSAGSYPNLGSSNASYFWVDAVFSTQQAPSYPLSVGGVQPKAGAYGVQRSQNVTASFNRQLDSTTVTNTSFRLFDSSNVQVAGTASYDTVTGLATFAPTSPLTYGQSYTAKISSTVADPAGVTLGSEYTWSFTVGSQLSSDPTQGAGGPILVVTSSANKYSQYYAEILHTEGFNYFDVKDITTVDAATLNNYDTVVLSELSLSQSQADMLSTWVNAGGNLVAMRPDSKLASLLGLTSSGTTRANQYMLIDTSQAPGTGLVNETIQFKGTADNYTLNGATQVATFYSDASTGTSSPAVSTHSVGANGGTAVAFSYDLAKSVIGLHQGNQAWANLERDGVTPIRPNDLFFGARSGDVQPDWVDLNKIHIPQADEQQRLLANVLIQSTKDRKPLPHFWYLPGDYKAAMVFAGDDHAISLPDGTQAVMDKWLNYSATDCSLIDWECIRASHYIYVGSGITNARVQQFYDLGFEIGDHVGTSCGDFASFASLSAEYTSNLATWRAKYTSVPNQVSHRYHCYTWSDWDSQSRVDAANGIRYDLNYLTYPNTWIGTRSPLITGSGMNMRFTDATGNLMDVHQGVTNFDDQSVTSTNINTALDNATGAQGYYGIFGTHYDMTNTFDSTLYDAAKSHNVPIISATQALTWLDGRDSSTFSDFSGSNGLFTYTISPAVGASGLKAMMPTHDAGGTLSTLKLGSSTVTYATSTVKGVEYAVFNAAPGAYTATYSDYNPNAQSSSGGSSTTTTTPTTTKHHTTSNSSSGAAAEEPVAANTTETAATGSEPQAQQEPTSNDTQTITHAATPVNLTWLWVAGGVGLALVLYWLIWRRRHQRE